MKTKTVMASLVPLIALSACVPSTPMSQNPNRIRSAQRIAYEACLQKFSNDESQCKQEKHDLLMQQEWEMMTPNR
jgi:hypothetical protein